MAQENPDNGSTLELLKRKSLPSAIQNEIERMILDCTFTPGKPLREASLAEQQGVSRGTIPSLNFQFHDQLALACNNKKTNCIPEWYPSWLYSGVKPICIKKIQC